MSAAEPTHECRVEGLSLDGRGVLRIDGRVHLLPNLVPGERVLASPTQQTKKKPPLPKIERLDTSPHRKAPPCLAQKECGGCPLMHIDAEFALAEKVRTARWHLRKIIGEGVSARGANFREELHLGKDSLGYRTRARMLFSDRRLGYREAARNTLSEIPGTCIILDPRLERALRRLRADWIAHVHGSGELYLASGKPSEQGQARATLRIRCDVSQSATFYQRTAALLGDDIAGIAVEIAGTTTNYGNVQEYFLDPDGHTLAAGPGGFYQGNTEINTVLGAFVLRALGDVKNKSVFDLYAGAGNFALPLARRGASVVAVESAPVSKQALLHNAERENLTAQIQAHGETVEAFVAKLTRKAKPAYIVLDPPRAGAKDILPQLMKLAPERIVYVSCDLATLARDLEQAFSGEPAYRASHVAFFDMFPQTAHIESAVVLEKA